MTYLAIHAGSAEHFVEFVPKLAETDKFAL